MAQHSQPYMTTGKTIALTIWTFVVRVMSLLFNTLSFTQLSCQEAIIWFHGCSHHLQWFFFHHKYCLQDSVWHGVQRLSFQHQCQEVWKCLEASVGHKCFHMTPETWLFLDVSIQVLEKSTSIKIMGYSKLLIRCQMVYESFSKTTDFHFFAVKQTADIFHLIFSH